MLEDDDDLVATVNWYHENCPDPNDAAGKNKKRGSLPALLDFLEGHRKEEQVIRDTVREMLTIYAWQALAAKPKFGSLSADDAKIQWEAAASAKGATVDYKGVYRDQKNLKRVAILTKEQLIDRDVDVKFRGYQVSEKQKKNPVGEDLEKAEAKLHLAGDTMLEETMEPVSYTHLRPRDLSTSRMPSSA